MVNHHDGRCPATLDTVNSPAESRQDQHQGTARDASDETEQQPIGQVLEPPAAVSARVRWEFFGTTRRVNNSGVKIT
jgi:hypothetical protein